MANTPSFNWQTPDDTSLVKDGAAAIRTLGNAIDSSMTDLKGGTTGQVLSKASNTDMDFVWVTENDADAIQNTIVDAKGDLISATAADTPARLAVGTNGQVLTADSTTATGLKWATNTVVNPFLGYKVTGGFYGIGTITSPVARTGVLNNRTFYYAIYFDGTTNFDRIGFRTAGTFSGTAVCRLGIYNASSTTGLPTTVYLDAGTVSATAVNTDYLITINSTPPAGYYYIAVNCQTAATTNAYMGIGTASPNIVNPFGKNDSTGFGYSYFSDTATVTSGFATAGTLTLERTIEILGFLRMA